MSLIAGKAIPLSLYIHTPWCVQKCPYCDFNSHTLKQALPEEAYVQAVIQDLDLSLVHVQDRPILSIFIGGGTPSLFSSQSIEQLLKAVQQRVTFQKEIEITLEANPGTVEQSRFEGFLDAGINRLSMGIQSFDDAHLKKLGRIHGGLEARRAIEAAFLAGFERINLDIMYGLPQQTMEEAISDINTAISWRPEHISWYQLTLEENTPFYRHPPVLPNDEICWNIQKAGQALLKNQGYLQYEVSAYGQKDAFCQHNLNYWEFGDYLGIGAGACSKITDLKDGSIQRILKKKHPQQYLNSKGDFISHERKVQISDLPLEFMMNILRLNKPFEVGLFEERTGLPLESIEAPLKKAAEKGWLTRDHHSVKLTEQGYLFLNTVIELFMPEE